MRKNNECTVTEAATALGKKYYQVLRLIKKRKLKARKVGWFYLVDRGSVRRYQLSN